MFSKNSTSFAVTAAIAIGVVGATYVAFRYLSSQPKRKVVFVLGGPGAGKGTNCTKITENFGYVHLSAGDLLREERNSGSALADMINTFIKEGKIVPAEVTVRLLRTAMEKSGASKFLVDGFPRDMDNLRCWEDKMRSFADVQFLLFLDCPHHVMTSRLLERGKTSGRSDDNLESIKKRLVTYEESTRPIIEHFRRQGKVRTVDSNRDPDAVFADVTIHFRSVATDPSN
jgi:UMP-CMP kinase